MSKNQTIAEEAAKQIYDKLSNLGKVKKEPYDHFEWSHHPQEFLPSNVCCDHAGFTYFKQTIEKCVLDVLEKYNI